jgi:hypothetical protein
VQQEKLQMENQQPKSNSKPTGQSSSTSRKPLIGWEEVKDWVRKGHCQLAEGNTILWTPEELAAMTPEERARCAPPSPKE